MTETDNILAAGTSSITYDDGNCRDNYRVAATGEVQTGIEVYRDKRWHPPTQWTAWPKKEVIQASKSPGGLDSHKWFCGLGKDVRAVIRHYYGLIAVGSYACAAHRDGCQRTVSRPGEYCSSCRHDA